jgi:hypothetical protein
MTNLRLGFMASFPGYTMQFTNQEFRQDPAIRESFRRLWKARVAEHGKPKRGAFPDPSYCVSVSRTEYPKPFVRPECQIPRDLQLITPETADRLGLAGDRDGDIMVNGVLTP